jgi:hypothetical protein
LKKVYSEHHVIPRSRGGEKEKIVLLPKLFHTGWHIVFGNLYGKEIEIFIKEVNHLLKIKDTISAHELEQLRNRIKRG